jgi:hypothetical protein
MILLLRSASPTSFLRLSGNFSDSEAHIIQSARGRSGMAGHRSRHGGRESQSQAWKSMLSTWRLVVAAMPDRPELEQPFAFMQQYMSVHHSAPTPEPASPALSKTAS